MANVIDVSTSGDPDAAVLTDTGTSGVFGGQYLRSQPLAAYLGEHEVAHFVLRNKKSGIEIHPGDGDAAVDDRSTPTSNGATTNGDGAATDGRQDLEPASDYQALAAVTDVRIVFAVGTADGDRTASVPLSDVASVHLDSGMLGGELAVVTTGDDRYVFPCRGNLEPVAEFVDRGSQAWARAYTLLEEARDALRTAEDDRRDGAYADAVAAVDDAVDAVEAAHDRLSTFGEGAARSLEPEVRELRETLEERRREIYVEHGIDAHEQARRHWGNAAYERSHAAFEESREALERAQELEATEDVAERIERIDAELDDLADAPLSYANTMLEEARVSDDYRTKAQCFAVAIERYRDAYALDWAREDERFAGDPDAIRERVLGALDDLVAYRVAATEEQLDQAEWLRQSDDIDGARDVLEDAIDTVEGTERLVDELSHREYPELGRVRRDAEADLAALPDP